ncbi:hypothetical protein J5751_07750 [bacterium]|nr:hypothetical protein [bacterium]
MDTLHKQYKESYEKIEETTEEKNIEEPTEHKDIEINKFCEKFKSNIK